MTLISSIDGELRRIYLHPDTVGADIHPMDLYKEMRVLRKNDESLRKYNLFLKAFGNVSKGGGKATERYVRCEQGTRIVPYDASHTLTLTGTIITDDGKEGIFCFDKAPLTITTSVDINYVPPQVEVITIQGGSGLDSEQTQQLNEIHSGVDRVVNIDTTKTIPGDGSPSAPFNTVDAAVDYANVNGIRKLRVRSDILLNRDLQGFDVVGLAAPEVDFGGYDITASTFQDLSLTGNHTGRGVFRECSLVQGLSGMNGLYVDCPLAGDVSTAQGTDVTMNNVYSSMAGNSRPSITVGDGSFLGDCNLSVRNYSGGLIIKGAHSGDNVTIDVSQGSIRFAGSCTGGSLLVRGVAFVEDLSVGKVVDVSSSVENLIWNHSQ